MEGIGYKGSLQLYPVEDEIGKLIVESLMTFTYPIRKRSFFNTDSETWRKWELQNLRPVFAKIVVSEL